MENAETSERRAAVRTGPGVGNSRVGNGPPISRVERWATRRFYGLLAAVGRCPRGVDLPVRRPGCWPARRRYAFVAVTVSILAVLVLTLSSAIPSPGSWHSENFGSSSGAAAAASGMFTVVPSAGYANSPQAAEWSYTFSFNVPSGVGHEVYVWAIGGSGTSTVYPTLPSGMTVRTSVVDPSAGNVDSGIAMGTLPAGNYSIQLAYTEEVNAVSMELYLVWNDSGYTYQFSSPGNQSTQVTLSPGASAYLGSEANGGVWAITSSSLSPIDREAAATEGGGDTELIGRQSTGDFSFQTTAEDYGITAVGIYPSAGPPSPFYPYVAPVKDFPAPERLTPSVSGSPDVVEASGGCSGPTAVVAGTEVSGGVGPNGCALYTYNVTEAAWSGAFWIDAFATASTIVGTEPAFALYGEIASAPGPSTWAGTAVGPDAGMAACTQCGSGDAANVWGGWGTYEYMVMADGSSYGSYCFEIELPDVHTYTYPYSACPGPTPQIEVSSGGSSLALAFDGMIAGGTPPYAFSWTFGDSTGSTAQDPSHTYAKSGTYPVSLKVEDANGLVGTSELTVAVSSTTGSPVPSLPRLASAVMGSIPVFLLVEAWNAPSGLSTVQFLTGTYSSVAAGEIYNSTATGDLPIDWSLPISVASFSSPITGDDLVASANGSRLAVAVSSGGNTWVFRSSNGGAAWLGLTPTALPGGEPGLAAGTPGLIVTTVAGSTVHSTTLSAEGYGAPDVAWSDSPVSAAPVWASGIADGEIGVAVTTFSGSVLYYTSINSGYTYTSTTVGTLGETSNSSVFQSLGATQLTDPAGVAGAVTVAADGSNVFLLYTSEVSGRVVANVTTSPNGGASWDPTVTYGLPIGSIGQPEAVASAVGYVYVTWTDDSYEIPGIDEAVFLADGQIVQNASMLPGSGGEGAPPASSPTVSLDALQRPLYVWVVNGSSPNPWLRSSGGFLSPKNALAVVNATFRQLTGWDLKPPAGGGGGQNNPESGGASQLSIAEGTYNLSALALGNVLTDPSSNPCFPGVAQNDTAQLYHLDTSFPFLPENPPSACFNASPAKSPGSNVTGTSGAFAASTYMSVLTDWIFEGLGVQVAYTGDALVSALNVGVNPNSTGLPPPVEYGFLPPSVVSLPTDSCSPCEAVASTYFSVLNPTTAVLTDFSVSFPPPYSEQSVAQCNGGTRGFTVYTNSTSLSSLTATYSIEGRPAVTYPGAYPSYLPGDQLYLTNLTPNSGTTWNAWFNATLWLNSTAQPEDGCAGQTTTTSLGSSFAGPHLSDTLYTNLSMIPSETVGSGRPTFARVSEAAPTLDGEAESEDQLAGSVSAALTTVHAPDVILAMLAVNQSEESPTCTDADSHSWSLVYSAGASYSPTMFVLATVAQAPLASDEITCSVQGGSSHNYDLSVFGVSGANLTDPFVLGNTTASLGGGTPSAAVTITTGEAPALLLGFLAAQYNTSVPAGPQFTELPYDGTPQALVEYRSVSSPGTYTVALGGPINPGYAWVFKALAVQAGSSADVQVSWNNTMNAETTASILGPSDREDLSDTTPGVSEAYNFSSVPASSPTGPNYTLSLSATSAIGAWSPSDSPSLSAGEVSYSNPLTASYSCSFPVTTAEVSLYGPEPPTVDPTANKATITWLSNVNGTGWVDYFELGVGLNWTQSATVNISGNPDYRYQYTVELQGLTPASLYGVTVWTSWVPFAGCVSYAASGSTVFVSSGGFRVSETDLAYDSITDEGGGALLRWNVAPGFVSDGQFVNGTVTYENETSTPALVSVPLLPGSGVSQSASAFEVNLSLPQPNSVYNVSVVLNFSLQWQGIDEVESVESVPLTFTYLKDTSGDGLSDAEKILGWTVPVTNVTGQTTDEHVQANPEDWATNGLTKDYLEKEDDLDPNTLDTAGSHMLDLWNLTFEVGTTAGTCPADFECWDENTTDPFDSPQFPGGPHNGSAASVNSTAPHYLLDDGSTRDAESLWTAAPLAYLQSLITSEGVGWLRATTGYYAPAHEYTITVWGKLSWGANPLATSTPADGLPDGERVNPVSATELQVSVTAWSVSGLSKGDSVAAFVDVRSSEAPGYPTGQTDYSNFTSQTTVSSGSSTSFSGDFVVTFPVVPTEQFAKLNVSLVKNTGTSSSPKYGQVLDSATYAVDLENLSSQPTHTASASGASLSFHYQTLVPSFKAPTWVLAPANNTTLSPLPAGLSRYTAEQDFDLLVLNDTSSNDISLSSVDGPGLGWTYSFTLQPGMNNLLVPRGLFLASPLGQALINATAVDLPSSHQDSGLSFHPGDWIGRVVAGSSNQTDSIRVFSNDTQSCSASNAGQCGGVASDPQLEKGNESRQVQAVFWINVSTSGNSKNLTSGAAELADLLGGLVFNVTSGNVTNNLLNETASVSTLGFSENVLTALANASFPNDGAYGPPVASSSQKAPSGWAAIGSALYNAISGVVIIASKVLSVVYNAAIAAATYLGTAAKALLTKLGITALAKQTASALHNVATAMEAALRDLLSFIYEQIEAALSLAFAPLTRVMAAYDSNLAASTNATVADVASGLSVTPGQALAEAAALSSIMPLGFAIGAVLSVVFTLLTPVDLGADFVLPIILTLVTIGGTLAFSSVSGNAYLSSAGVWFVDDLVNRTVAANEGSTPQLNWKALAESTALAAAITGVPLSVSLGVVEAESEDAQLLWPIIALVFDLVALVLAAVTWARSTPALVVSATVTATVALLVSLRATNQLEDETLRPLILLDGGLGIVALGASLGDIEMTFG
jgi:hypothetical protein